MNYKRLLYTLKRNLNELQKTYLHWITNNSKKVHQNE